MSTSEQRAHLRWVHENVCPDNVRTARHFINWAGAKALAACTAEQDFEAVALCFDISNQLIIGDSNG